MPSSKARSQARRARALRPALLPIALFAVIGSLPTSTVGASETVPAPAAFEVTRAIEAPAIASSILSVAARAIGTYQGECFPWVRRVVAEATGRQMGFDYHEGYLTAGASEVPLSDARAGDIIQLINDADDGPNADYPGMHTSIISEVLGGGLFTVIDSNLGFDGIVRPRADYNPMALAGRYAGINVHVYRFGAASATDPAAASTSATPQSNQLIAATPTGGGATPQQATSDTAVIRADGDCLRLRSGPSTSAPVLTCLSDGSTVTMVGGTQQADGVVWQAVTAGGRSGWVASQYLVRASTSAPPSSPPASAPVSTLPAAPPAPAPQQQPSASIIGDLQTGGGLALVVFSGGSVDSLLGAIAQRGCAVTSVWTSPPGGGLVGMIAGAPAVVNRQWNDVFPDGTLGPSSPLIVVCRGGPPPQLVAQAPAAPAPGGTVDRGAGPPGPAGNE